MINVKKIKILNNYENVDQKDAEYQYERNKTASIQYVEWVTPFTYLSSRDRQSGRMQRICSNKNIWKMNKIRNRTKLININNTVVIHSRGK